MIPSNKVIALKVVASLAPSPKSKLTSSHVALQPASNPIVTPKKVNFMP
jgi:hypothetical protein